MRRCVPPPERTRHRTRLEQSLRILDVVEYYHCRILRAIQDHDGSAARRLMSEHICGSLRERLDEFDQARPTDKAVWSSRIPMTEAVFEELNNLGNRLGIKFLEFRELL